MQRTLLVAAVAAALTAPATLLAQQTPPADPAPTAPTAPTADSAIVAPPAAAMPEQRDVLAVARTAGTYTTLLRAIEVAGLEDELAAMDSVTLLAPTDEAFALLPEGALDALLADTVRLREVLLGHVLPTRVLAADAGAQESATTASGSALAIARDGEDVTLGGAKVVQADLLASNGIVHGVGAVILPATATGTAEAAETASEAAKADDAAKVETRPEVPAKPAVPATPATPATP